jgi:hypothetical protein
MPGPDRLHDSAHTWWDGDAGPVVRPYTVTRGRARPAAGTFDLVAYVVAVNRPGARTVNLQPEHRAILHNALEPASVAEIASDLDLAVGVVRVLLGDLLEDGLIAMYEPPGPDMLSDDQLLAVLNGLRSL